MLVFHLQYRGCGGSQALSCVLIDEKMGAMYHHHPKELNDDDDGCYYSEKSIIINGKLQYGA